MRISKEDVVAEAKAILASQYVRYGLPVADDMLTTYAEEIFAKEEDRRRLVDRIAERRAVDLLKTKVTIQPKAVSPEEFGRIAATVR